jgi:16S rRNA processing protein RimM
MAVDRWVAVGKFGAVHGIDGSIKVFSSTEPPDNIFKYQPWRIESEAGLQELSVDTVKTQAKSFVVQVKDLSDREKARTLTNKLIYVARSQLPKLPSGEYYWCDLEGLLVKNLEGFEFGRIEYLVATGANDVMYVKGEQLHCLPYLPKQVIKEIKLAEGLMIVDWPPEL